jgi:hypothetical protein
MAKLRVAQEDLEDLIDRTMAGLLRFRRDVRELLTSAGLFANGKIDEATLRRAMDEVEKWY